MIPGLPVVCLDVVVDRPVLGLGTHGRRGQRGVGADRQARGRRAARVAGQVRGRVGRHR